MDRARCPGREGDLIGRPACRDGPARDRPGIGGARLDRDGGRETRRSCRGVVGSCDHGRAGQGHDRDRQGGPGGPRQVYRLDDIGIARA